MKYYFLKSYRRAITVFVIALIIDFAARFYFDFQMDKIFLAEAILFLISGFVLLWLMKKDDSENKSVARFDFWFAIFFILGGLRPALFLIGLSIFTSNLITFFAGIIILVIIFSSSKAKKE